MIAERVIEEVRDRADVLEVVGRYVSLKRSGNRFWGLCPFHSEKTPSFTVSPEKQVFHCFGCGAGGDVFAFRMRHDGLEFLDAVRALADEFGVVVPERGDPGASRSAALHRINEVALDFFRDALRSPEGSEARAYLDRRGLPQDLRERFQLGYAPGRWEGLCDYLRSQGAKLEDAERAGLIAARSNGPGHYDRFRDRVLFPIREPSGRLIGFGGRAVGDDTPKYLNSPESPIYQKSRALFGFPSALEAMRERGRVIVVEGYFDLFALHRAGRSECVAPCGTALTRAHAARLRRYVPECVLLFDGDAAGRGAAERALPALLDSGLRVRAAFLPADEDPDTLLEREGAEALREVVEAAPPLLDHLIDSGLSGLPVRPSAWQIADALNPLRSLLAAVPDRLERELHIREIAGRLGVRAEQVDRALQEGSKPGRGREPEAPSGSPGEPSSAPSSPVELDPISRELASALAVHPDLAPELDTQLAREALATLPPGPGRELTLALIEAGREHGVNALAKLLSPASDGLAGPLRALLSRLAAEDRAGPRPGAQRAVQDCLAQLQLRQLERESLRIKRELETCSDPREVQTLLEKKQNILAQRTELWSRVQQV